MITNKFMDLCFSYILSYRKLGGVLNADFTYRMEHVNAIKSIYYIMADFKKINSDELTPMKIELLMIISKLVKVGLTPSIIFKNVFSDLNKKYDELRTYCQNFQETEITRDDEEFIEKKIEFFSKRLLLTTDSSLIKSVINKIDEGEFESIEEMFSEYHDLINSIYLKMVLGKYDPQVSEKENVKCLGLRSLTRKVKETSVDSEKNVVYTVDKYNVAGMMRDSGFENKRIYIFAAPPATGKSQLLLNIYRSFVTRVDDYRYISGKKADGRRNGKKIVSIPFFFTLENTIQETEERLIKSILNHIYCGCHFPTTMLMNNTSGFPKLDERTSAKVKNEIKNIMNTVNTIPGTELSQRFETIVDLIHTCDPDYMANSPFFMFSLSAYTTQASHIIKVIERNLQELNSQAKEQNQMIEYICGPLVIDYLDLLDSQLTAEHYRLMLGHVTMEIKAIGTIYNVPTITATQVNTYIDKQNDNNGNNQNQQNTQSSYKLSNLSESKKKAENADFVAFLLPEPQNQFNVGLVNQLNLICKKYRSYKESTLQLAVNRSMHYMSTMDLMNNTGINKIGTVGNNTPNNIGSGMNIPSFHQNNNPLGGFNNSMNKNTTPDNSII